MPSAGTSRPAARRAAVPWWEELDREAFREFPGTRESRGSRGTRGSQGTRAASAPKPAPDASTTPVRPSGRAEPAGAEAARAEAAGAEAGVRSMPADRTYPTGRAEARVAGGAVQPAAPAPNGRRTVTIRGYGAERNLPVARPTVKRHERPGFKPDRAALWAVMLGLFLILVAAASAHAAVAHHVATHLIR